MINRQGILVISFQITMLRSMHGHVFHLKNGLISCLCPMFYSIHSCPNATCCPRFIPFSIQKTALVVEGSLYYETKSIQNGDLIGPPNVGFTSFANNVQTEHVGRLEQWNIYSIQGDCFFWCVSPRTTSHAMFACMAPVWCMVAAEVGKGATTWIGWALGGLMFPYTNFLYCMPLYPHIAIDPNMSCMMSPREHTEL